MDCPPLSAKIGKYNYSDSTNYDSEAAVLPGSCLSESDEPINETTVCQAAGSWSLPIPVCRGESRVDDGLFFLFTLIGVLDFDLLKAALLR